MGDPALGSSANLRYIASVQVRWHSMQMVMDTHRVVKRLKEAGFTDTQAEVVIDIVRDAREMDRDDLVTKNFLKAELAEFKADLLKWLLPMMVGQVALTAALVKLL